MGPFFFFCFFFLLLLFFSCSSLPISFFFFPFLPDSIVDGKYPRQSTCFLPRYLHLLTPQVLFVALRYLPVSSRHRLSRIVLFLLVIL